MDKKAEQVAARARKPGPLEYSGLDIKDAGEFIEAVEAAFDALHQPTREFDGEAEEEDKDSLPLAPGLFVEWAKGVEERLEYMGLAHIALGLPDKPTSGPLDPAALKIWTQRVWARFAAFGQVLPGPKKK